MDAQQATPLVSFFFFFFFLWWPPYKTLLLKNSLVCLLVTNDHLLSRGFFSWWPFLLVVVLPNNPDSFNLLLLLLPLTKNRLKYIETLYNPLGWMDGKKGAEEEKEIFIWSNDPLPTHWIKGNERTRRLTFALNSRCSLISSSSSCFLLLSDYCWSHSLI